MLVLAPIKAKSDTYCFPVGDVPTVSLVEAAGICKKLARAVGISPFNPTRATLSGKKDDPKGGTWFFEQTTKEGVVYSFAVYFPEDFCVVTRGEIPDRKNLGVFKRSGERQKSLRWDQSLDEASPGPSAEPARSPSQGKPTVGGH